MLSEIVKISLISFHRIFKKENGYPTIISALTALEEQCIAMASSHKNLLVWETNFTHRGSWVEIQKTVGSVSEKFMGTFSRCNAAGTAMRYKKNG